MDDAECINKVKEFVVDELEDYGYFDFEDISFQDKEGDEYSYQVSIKTIDNKHKYLYFMYNKKEDQIYIESSEDNYEKINDYDYTIKYFWMTLLKWDV